VIIYVHGWQSGSVKDGAVAGTTQSNRRDEFFLNEGGANGNLNVANFWIDRGWNVGIFHWTQLADDDGYLGKPYAAQAKIWTTTYRRKSWLFVGGEDVKMRWRTHTGDRVMTNMPTEPAGKLFYNDYKAALAQWRYTGSEAIRVVGHSLGGQMALAMSNFAWGDSTLANTKKPGRVVLADPYWSPGSAEQGHHYDYLAPDANPAARARRIATTLAANGVTIEWYKTSRLNDIGGDNNMDLVYSTSRTELDPTFITDIDLVAGITRKHNVAPRFYFWTLQFAQPKECATNSADGQCIDSGRGALSASTTVARAEAIMDARSYYYQQVGNASPTPSDNGFKVTSVAKRFGVADSLRVEEAWLKANIDAGLMDADFGRVEAPNDVTAPTVPSEVRLDGGMLRWNASIDNVAVEGYIVLKNGVEIGRTSLLELAVDGAGQYEVRAFDGRGNTSAARLVRRELAERVSPE
jgi:pimeloyl-ACP methyl ester carboxylesterase